MKRAHIKRPENWNINFRTGDKFVFSIPGSIYAFLCKAALENRRRVRVVREEEDGKKFSAFAKNNEKNRFVFRRIILKTIVINKLQTKKEKIIKVLIGNLQR